MKANTTGLRVFALAAALLLGACAGTANWSESSREALRDKARASLDSLHASRPEARELRGRSAAILVFPDIVKAGLLVGGSGGNGVLFSPEGKVMGYYNAASLSYGLQAGVQDFALIMYLTTREALDYLDRSDGWSLGVGPTIVVVDEGLAKDLSTTTARSDVFAFIHGQKGLMGGIGIQGQKITKLRE